MSQKRINFYSRTFSYKNYNKLGLITIRMLFFFAKLSIIIMGWLICENYFKHTMSSEKNIKIPNIKFWYCYTYVCIPDKFLALDIVVMVGTDGINGGVPIVEQIIFESDYV